MNIDEKRKKAQELEEEILKIREEVRAELRQKYLPLLIQKAKVYYNGGYFSIEIDDETLKELLKEQEDNSWYHWSIEITDKVSLAGNDGKLDLVFLVGGTVTKMDNEKLSICKELKIPIDFSRERRKLEMELNRAQSRIDKLNKLEESYQL